MNLRFNEKPSKSDNSKTKLLIQLHGIGSNKDDLFSFANELPAKFTVLSAQAPIPYFGGWAWYNLYPATNGFTSNNVEAKQSLIEINKFIDLAIEKYNADEKVVLMGFSQGAILSLATAINNPNKIEKVVAMSGYLNPDFLDQPIADLPFPIFATHGTEDSVIPIEKAKSSYKDLAKQNFKFKSYPMPHGVSPDCLNDVISFLSN